MWRGFRDLGAALTSIAARNASAPASLRALGANLTAEAPPILRDLQVNIPCSSLVCPPVFRRSDGEFSSSDRWS